MMGAVGSGAWRSGRDDSPFAPEERSTRGPAPFRDPDPRRVRRFVPPRRAARPARRRRRARRPAAPGRRRGQAQEEARRSASRRCGATSAAAAAPSPACRKRSTPPPPRTPSGSARRRYREHVSVEKNLTLLGAGADRTVLDGGGTASAKAVLYVYAGAIVEVRGLTVRGGNSAVGGGIDNEGALTLDGVTVTANTADDGGGIFNLAGASLRLIDSRVSGNEADNGGGLWVDGGTVTLTRSRVTGNKARRGPRWWAPPLRRHGDAQRQPGDGQRGDRDGERRGWVLHLRGRPDARAGPR